MSFKKSLPILSLFTSLSTLICCALPALFVSLGMGASLVSLLGAVPQLVWFSEHKELVFGVAGGMLLLTGILRWKSKNLSCPTDPELAAQCRAARSWSGWGFALSIGLYALGAFFAFIAPLLM